MQAFAVSVEGGFALLEFPPRDADALPGVPWGWCEHPLTPAFWAAQARMYGEPDAPSFQLGASLAEEVSACLLGGHGAPAEVGLAAFARVRDAMRARNRATLSVAEAERLLSEPLDVGGRAVRYRFARQRARYLAGALDGLAVLSEAAFDDVALRDALATLPGIGPKTASWVVRNRRASDSVAILDVHVVRACRIMGAFPAGASPARDYAGLERRFLDLCAALGVRASVLDAVMWATMRALSRPLHDLLVDPGRRLPEKNGARTREARCPAATGTVGTSAVRTSPRTRTRAAARAAGPSTARTPP